MGFHVLATDGSEKTTTSGSSVTITTTGNIDDLDFSNATLIRVNNASVAQIRGLKAGVDGQIVSIISIGAGDLFLGHQNAGSVAANRLINFIASGATPLAAGVGAAALQYDATTARWRLVSHDQGASINVAYASGNFTADSGTWTVDAGDQTAYSYMVVDRWIIVTISLDTTSVSATPTILLVAMPNGYTAAAASRVLCQTQDAGGAVNTGLMFSTATTNTLGVFKTLAGAAWSIATNSTSCKGVLLLPLN